jgi:hypothetical protein
MGNPGIKEEGRGVISSDRGCLDYREQEVGVRAAIGSERRRQKVPLR